MKRLKKVVSLAIILAFILANTLTFAYTQNDCKEVVKNLLTPIVNYVKNSGSAEKTAEVISKFLSGSGKDALISAFRTIANGPGASSRLSDTLGLNEQTVGTLLDWMVSYQENTGKSWFVNLVNGNASLDDAANALAQKYIQTVGDVDKAYNQLNKMNAAFLALNISQYKPITFDTSTNMFSVNDNDLTSLISALNNYLVNKIESQDNINAIKSAFQTIVTAVNSITNTEEKQGAKALLQAIGIVSVYTPSGGTTPSGGAGGGAIGGGVSGGITTQPFQETQQPTQPTQPTQSSLPTPTTAADLNKQLDDIIKQGKFDQINNVVKVLPSIIKAEADVNKSISNLKEVTAKVATALDKVTSVTDEKNIVTNLVSAINTLASNIQSQSVSTVQKSTQLENLKYETAALLLKAYEVAAITPQKSESSTKDTFTVSADDVTSAISKATELSASSQPISNSTIKKALNMAGVSVSINAKTNKDSSIVLDKTAIDKLKSDSKITNLMVVTSVGNVIVPTSLVTGEKLEIQVSPKSVANSLSSAFDVNVLVGDNTQEKFSKPIVLTLKLNTNITDESKVAVYRLTNNGITIVPGIYSSTINSFIVERKSLSTYYVGNFAKTYGDVDSNAWYYNNIQLISAKGIATGYPDGTFKPQNNVTRAEFAKMVVEALQFDKEGQEVTKFDDVKSTDWFYPYVATLYNLGIISGRSETIFAPNEPITREEMAKMISLALVKAGKISSSVAASAMFNDNSSISSWAKNYVDSAVANGIMEGKGNDTFAPKDNATRAEVATVIIRALMK